MYKFNIRYTINCLIIFLSMGVFGLGLCVFQGLLGSIMVVSTMIFIPIYIFFTCTEKGGSLIDDDDYRRRKN